jgi:arginase family enzyme
MGCRIDFIVGSGRVDETIQHGVVGRESLLNSVATLQALLNANATGKTLLIGGDCACDLAAIAHHISSTLTVVYFDAHADINEPLQSPSGALHGMGYCGTYWAMAMLSLFRFWERKCDPIKFDTEVFARVMQRR